jgi:hypothetical protein
MQLDPNNYLIKSGPENYIVDIEKLREDTLEFIDEHHEFYKQLIAKYNETIDATLPRWNLEWNLFLRNGYRSSKR